MIDFAEAREIVEATGQGIETAGYGYESETRWYPVIAPERAGGRVPAVAKSDGRLTWVSSTTDIDFIGADQIGSRND